MRILALLELFLEELEAYSDYLFRIKNGKRLSKEDKESFIRTHDHLLGDIGAFEPLISELSGISSKDIIKGKEYDKWNLAMGSYVSTPEYLDSCIDMTKRAIGKLGFDIAQGIRNEEIGELIEKPVTVAGSPPKAFIAHGGKSEACEKLYRFLIALGVTPLIVEEQPSEGRSVGENVDWYARQADCAIILATKGDIDSKTGRFIPRGNVLIEIGKSQELFRNRIIYLLQAGAKFPTDINEKVRARFTQQNMDEAFITIARELAKFGILKAVKP